MKQRYMESLLDGKFKETKENVIQKAKKMTFDDLWDWRLHQGNRFIGKEMKETIAVFSQTNMTSPSRPLLHSFRENKELTSQVSVTHESPKKDEFDTDNEDGEEDGGHNSPDKRYKKQLYMII